MTHLSTAKTNDNGSTSEENKNKYFEDKKEKTSLDNNIDKNSS